MRDGVDDPPRALLGVARAVRLHASVRVLAEPSGAARPLVAGVLAGQPAAGERRPWQDPDALVAAHVDDLQLDVADEQVVLRLQRDDRRRVTGQQGGLLQLPADEVADPGVADLAGAHGVGEEAERLLDRGQRVPGMGLVEVDGVDAEAAQAGVEGAAKVGAGQAGVVRSVSHRKAALGGDDELVAHAGTGRQPPADDLLGTPACVHVGRVDEVPATLDEQVELLVSGLLVALVAERHRAEALR